MKHFLERLFPSLGRKIAIAVAIVFAGAGSAFVLFAHKTGYSMLEKQARAKAHAVVDFGKAILEHVMIEGKQDHLQDALASAISSQQADEVFIFRNDGTIVFSARGTQLGEKFRMEQFYEVPEWPGDRFRAIQEGDSQFKYIVSPIVKKQECSSCHKESGPILGYFAAKISISDLRAVALEHRTTNILMTVITFVGLGAAIYLALVALVIGPVGKLHSQIVRVEKEIAQLEEGETVRFTKLNMPSRRDEIADLIAAFNRLIERLNEAHDKLLRLHESQLEHADRLASTGEMAAGIAHEIKNPLAGVLGALQVLDAEAGEDDPRKEILREMITQLNRMNQAVNDLLSYARPAAPVFEEANLNEILDRTLSLLKPQFNGQAIAVNVQLDDTLPLIKADRKLLQQLFWNVLLNAFQAMKSDGVLKVQTMWNTHHVTIKIQDTGEGISEEYRAKIFKPFFTTKHKGTGLGLAISKRIAEQHEGRLSLETQTGKGTTVTITLPALHKEA